jgi:tungstate transport system ATP-binding protein
MTQALVTLSRVSVRLGHIQALHGIDLSLHRGERLVLVGANGSGKTTLLRLLQGLVDHTGERTLHDIGPAQPPVAAMVFQRPFMLNMSVRFNVALGLWLARVARPERNSRCDDALRRVGLGALAARSARELSGGQQQRLALARAWALRPDLLLLDEPTASLDPGAKREIESLIDSIAADGVTLVMSTHNLGQAKRVATRVAYLEAGRLVVDLPVNRFFTEALPAEAAQFLKGELPWQ